MEPSEHQDGTAATFGAAKVDFEQEWREIAPGIPENFSGVARPASDNRLEMRDARSPATAADANG
jgi:hypothetical protein